MGEFNPYNVQVVVGNDAGLIKLTVRKEYLDRIDRDLGASPLSQQLTTASIDQQLNPPADDLLGVPYLDENDPCADCCDFWHQYDNLFTPNETAT